VRFLTACAETLLAGRSNVDRSSWPNIELQPTSDAKKSAILLSQQPASAISVSVLQDGALLAGPGVSALETRMQRLEANIAADSANDLSELLSADIGKSSGAPVPEAPVDDGAEKADEKKASKCSCPNPCLHLWGGPIMPASDQTIWYEYRNIHNPPVP
jgi:hypothetical protein